MLRRESAVRVVWQSFSPLIRLHVCTCVDIHSTHLFSKRSHLSFEVDDTSLVTLATSWDYYFFLYFPVFLISCFLFSVFMLAWTLQSPRSSCSLSLYIHLTITPVARTFACASQFSSATSATASLTSVFVFTAYCHDSLFSSFSSPISPCFPLQCCPCSHCAFVL